MKNYFSEFWLGEMKMLTMVTVLCLLALGSAHFNKGLSYTYPVYAAPMYYPASTPYVVYSYVPTYHQIYKRSTPYHATSYKDPNPVYRAPAY